MDSITSFRSIPKTPAGWAEYWKAELDAAEKCLRDFRKEGREVDDKFRDVRKGNEHLRRLNLFNANSKIQQALTMDELPIVDVKRRFDDPDDDVARVAGVLLERLLNSDLEERGEGFEDAIVAALQDRLLPGLGQVRVRYDARFTSREVPPQLAADGTVLAPGYTDRRKTEEDAVLDYVHWADFNWSPCRVWSEVRWVSFDARMTKDAMVRRFGKEAVKDVQFSKKKTRDGEPEAPSDEDPWQRAVVKEIWHKETRKVFWWTEGKPVILDERDDPLKLRNFFPCPRPLRANVTTTTTVPRADYHLCADLYDEINRLTKRISLLTVAVKAVGTYDASQTGIKRMLEEGFDNDLIPVDNWASFGEKGGIEGVVDWMPIGDLVAALDTLTQKRVETIELLWQVSGMNDIMRGATAQGQTRTLGEQKMRTKYGSVLVHADQKEYARFVADGLALKAELVGSRFDDQTILHRANVASMPQEDQQLVMQALPVLRDNVQRWRLKIDPEQISFIDSTEIREERTAYLGALTEFSQAAAGMAEAQPGALPYMMKLLKWGLQGFRGADDIEGVVDSAIAQLEQAQEQGQDQGPPEAVQVEQAKQQGEMQLEQMRHQNKLQQIAAETQAKQTHTMTTLQAELQEISGNLQAELAKLEAEAGVDTSVAWEAFQRDMQRMMAEAEVSEATARNEHNRDLKREGAHTEMNILEANAKGAIDIEKARAVARAKPTPRASS